MRCADGNTSYGRILPVVCFCHFFYRSKVCGFILSNPQNLGFTSRLCFFYLIICLFLLRLAYAHCVQAEVIRQESIISFCILFLPVHIGDRSLVIDIPGVQFSRPVFGHRKFDLDLAGWLFPIQIDVVECNVC